MNNIKVFVLLAGMTALFGVVGNALGGQSGMVMALIFAGAMNFVMYFNSAKMVLRSYKAQIVSEQDAPGLYRMVEGIGAFVNDHATSKPEDTYTCDGISEKQLTPT